jgi:hypothetical protein
MTGNETREAMTKKRQGNARLDTKLLQMAQDFRGRIISHETVDKIIKRVLGGKRLPKKHR